MDVPPAPLFARSHGAGATFNVFHDMTARAATEAVDPAWGAVASGASDADNEVDSQEETTAMGIATVVMGDGGSSTSGGGGVHRSARSGGSSPMSRQRSSPLVSRKSPMMRGVVIRGREPPPTQILDFLYLGNAYDARNEQFLRANNVCTILNVSHEEYWTLPGVTVHWYKADDHANFNIAEYFNVAVKVLDAVRAEHFRPSSMKQEQGSSSSPSVLSRSESAGCMAGGVEEGGVPPTLVLDSATGEAKRPTVLVHCQKGRSRSATIVMAYLIKANGWTVTEALTYCTKRRPSVEPNIGFLSALGEWQEAMDNDERSEKRGRQCLSLRNAHSTPQAVNNFFEKHVGLVMDVTSYQSDAAVMGKQSTSLLDEGDHAMPQETAAVRSDDAPSSAPESQRLSTSTCGATESSDGSPGKVATSVAASTVAAAAAHSSSSYRPQQRMLTAPLVFESGESNEAGSNHDGGVGSMSESALDGEGSTQRSLSATTTTDLLGATVSKPPVRLFLVFFSCWENVATARRLLKMQPELFAELGNPSEMVCSAARRDTARAKRVRRPPMHHK